VSASMSNPEVLFQTGAQLMRDGDSGTAISYWKRAAQGGHAVAAYNVGMYYKYADSEFFDQNSAFDWYKRAHELGGEAAREQVHLYGTVRDMGQRAGAGQLLQMTRYLLGECGPYGLSGLMLECLSHYVMRDLPSRHDQTLFVGDERAALEQVAVQRSLSTVFDVLDRLGGHVVGMGGFAW